jgi:hypothetical protein
MLERKAFPNFDRFLSVMEPYADETGCRFRITDWPPLSTPTIAAGEFVVVPDTDEEPGVRGTSSSLENQRKIVVEFSERLKSGEPGLLTDISFAAKICEQEGLRNVMIATCKELRLWPPTSEDRLESIAYSDTSEPLDAIAWALYNHEKCLNESDRESHDRLCRTASFLVDFAHSIGVTNGTTTSKAGSILLTDFLTRAKEWTHNDSVGRRGLRNTVVKALRDFVGDPEFVHDIEIWLDKHWEAVAVGSIALVAGFALAAIAFGSTASRK